MFFSCEFADVWSGECFRLSLLNPCSCWCKEGLTELEEFVSRDCEKTREKKRV